MKAVVDTNVFVSSFFGGNPKKIIDLWKNGELLICLSKPILDEYIEVLQKMGLKNEEELGELLSLFGKGFHILFTTRTPKLKLIKKDPDDDKFIKCAVALKAEVIITGDRDVEKINNYINYMGIKILTPQKFLKWYKKDQ